MKEKKTLYIGTYTNMSWSQGEKGKGLYRCDFDTESGEITVKDYTDGLINPSYGRFNAEGDRLYIINEVQPLDETCIGGVTSFIVKEDGALELGGNTSSFGLSPCYIAIGPDKKSAYLTNYVSATAVSLEMDDNGVLGAEHQHVTHSGSSVNPRRQNHAYAHSLIFSLDGKYLFVADLGIDKVMIYRMVEKDGGLWMEYHGFAPVEAGMGPRHMAFDKEGNRLYLICEMGSTMYVFDFDKEAGTLTEVQHISTLPVEGFAEENNCADLHFSEDYRFLYGSNRGHDSIVIYSVCPESGKLALVGHCSTDGRTPRNFTLTEDGEWLLAANQDSNSVVSLKVNKETGLLEQKSKLEIPAPVWLGIR